MITEDQLIPGTKFSTPYEDNGTVVTKPDKAGCFVGINSDGIKCTYSVQLVSKIFDTKE